MNVMDRFRDLLPAKPLDISALRERTYGRSPEVVWVSQRGTTVLFDVDRGTYESLNEVATTVWQALADASGATLDNILDAVKAEYDLPPEIAVDQVERDVAALLVRLEHARMIVRISNGS